MTSVGRYPRFALASAAGIAGAVGALCAILPVDTSFKPTVLVFIAAAAIADVVSAKYAARIQVTGVNTGSLIAAFALGPFSGVVVAFSANLIVWGLTRYRPASLLINLAGFAAPALIAGGLLTAFDDGVGLVYPLVLATAIGLALNLALVGGLLSLLDGQAIGEMARSLRGLRGAIAVQYGFIVALTIVIDQFGAAASLLVMVMVVAFAYMSLLLVRARDSARAYANLSWGLLSGLIRTLDARDKRAARHCAAVARFSRDMAAEVGMNKQEQELAHTAGLLHDIGRFALSDRVMDRGTQLQPDDWKAIRRHPELGADLLKDIGVYGPVAEIVMAHHERPDGRGYPRGLTADDIPEIAKIVAVAEVYDTLTAPDTYRTQMNSFEALTELRRVAGSQLDADYVEVLAKLLSGQGTDYRHADAADFDAELDIQRRMNEAAGL